MQSCLGFYIEDNLIKYAKVSKNNENIKVESFGVKFYENIETAIKQIADETYSFKIPMSINSDDEWYNQMQVFNLLTKKDMGNVIKTEFENICYVKEVNQNTYEQRHVFTNSYNGDDKIKAIHIAVPKALIEQRKNQFSSYRVNNIVPIGVVVSNLIKSEKKGTNIIVNIEEKTTITKITNGVVSDVHTINVGAGEILKKISQKENSVSKAYEICKSATIYTETDKELQYEENEYLEDIMPTLFQIVSQVKKSVNESMEKIDNVYITGTGAVVNNIDIYFQEYLKETHCEILKPSFINSNSKINIKDYIEVNSAIAIALQGLEKNNPNINFKEDSKMEKIFNVLTSDVQSVNYSEVTDKAKDVLDKFSRQWDMLSMTFVLLLIAYFVGTSVIGEQMDKKIEQTNASIATTTTNIRRIQENNSTFKSRKEKYIKMINSIQDLNNANSEDKRYKNTIPNKCY